MHRLSSEGQTFFNSANIQSPPTSSSTTQSKVRFTHGDFPTSLEDSNRQLVPVEDLWDDSSPKKIIVPADALGILISFPPATPDIFKSKIQRFNHSVFGFAVSEKDSCVTLYGFIISSGLAALLALVVASVSFPLKAYGTAGVLIVTAFASVVSDLGAFVFRSHAMLGLSICTHVLLGYLAIGSFVAALMSNYYLEGVVLGAAILLVLAVAIHLLLIGSLANFLQTDNVRLIYTEQENMSFPVPRLFVANQVQCN